MNTRLLTAAGLLLGACASEPAPKSAPSTESAQPAELTAQAAPAAKSEPAPAQASVTRVDPELVCMVNNHYMGKAQIPVVVEGKTYFGCCDMCKTKLAQDPESRAAKDPVSGATVDKASAVIGREPSGTVVYFENEKNLQQYASR